MSTTVASSSYSRRDFLRAAGVAAGAATALAVLPAGMAIDGSLGKSHAPLRLAALIPQSALHPLLGEELLAGLRLGFEATSRSVTLRIEAIGSGASLPPSSVGALLDDSGADLLVSMVDPGVATGLSALLAERDVPLVNTTIGANAPRLADASPHIFHASLGHWRANWALGHWAAGTLGRRGVIATSFYESGYDAHYAFRLGFEAAGGEIVATRTTHIPANEATVAGFLAGVAVQGADFVYAAYSGAEADDFGRAYAASGLASRLPVIASSRLGDGSALPEAGIRTASAWSAGLASAENSEFVAAYRAQFGVVPGAIALLGYETAQLIATAAAKATPQTGDNGALLAALASAQFVGPRGLVTMDAASHELLGSVYLSDGAPLATPEAGNREVAALQDSLKTGWLTPYLCG